MSRRKKPQTAMSLGERVKLRNRLFEIETEHLHNRNNDENMKEIVNTVMKKIIRPALKGLYTAERFVGSSYELTSLPGKSDFDVQIYLNMPSPPGKKNVIVSTTGLVENCDRPGWRKVKGGPSDLLTSRGYLSAKKVRRAFQSRIDSFLGKTCEVTTGKGSVTIHRTESGPATTLVLSQRGCVITTIDVVTCVRGTSISPKSKSVNLVAKPYNKENPDDHEDCWRMSCSRREKERFKKTYKNRPRVLNMLKIIKLVKEYDSQMKQFPSYFYKNVMLELMVRRGNIFDWERANFEIRFEGLIKVIYNALTTRCLRVFYNEEENLLSTEDPYSYEPLRRRLADIIQQRAYIGLLEVVP